MTTDQPNDLGLRFALARPPRLFAIEPAVTALDPSLLNYLRDVSFQRTVTLITRATREPKARVEGWSWGGNRQTAMMALLVLLRSGTVAGMPSDGRVDGQGLRTSFGMIGRFTVRFGYDAHQAGFPFPQPSRWETAGLVSAPTVAELLTEAAQADAPVTAKALDRATALAGLLRRVDKDPDNARGQLRSDAFTRGLVTDPGLLDPLTFAQLVTVHVLGRACAVSADGRWQVDCPVGDQGAYRRFEICRDGSLA